MIEIGLIIIWLMLAPVVDGLIYPDLIYNHFQGGLPVWVYLLYFGGFFCICLWTYYRHIEGSDID
jgi:hypothetical protein